MSQGSIDNSSTCYADEKHPSARSVGGTKTFSLQAKNSHSFERSYNESVMTGLGNWEFLVALLETYEANFQQYYTY
jgi:hypothetical protein